ncbi:sortase [Streptodolium elevatio]|uniref:Class E sortase n=1 Tax=Streptodolium elevatio TaxID=3157996 RepID=A0ABV3DV35_9ACTN
MTTVDPRPDTAVPPAPGTGGAAARPTEPRTIPRKPGDVRPPWDPVTIAGVAMGLVVVLLGGFIGYLAVASDLQQARTQRELFDRVSDSFYNDTAPIGGAIKEGTPVAVLEIPAIDLRQVVVEGTTARELRGGPGHLRNTSLPGGFGNSVLMGKAWTYGAPFGRIDALKPGQRIYVTTQQGDFTYLVREKKHIRNGADDAISPGGAHQLTLVTADSRWRPRGRTVVVADLQGEFRIAEPGRPRTVRDDEKGTGGESGAGIGLLLWAQALALVVAVAVWALRRYDRRVTLLLGVPIATAVLWSLYDAAARLLPATL